MDCGEDFWEIIDNPDQDDMPFLRLTSTETTPLIDHFSGHLEMEHGLSSRAPTTHFESIDPNGDLPQGNSSESIISPPACPPSTAENDQIMPAFPSHIMFPPAHDQMIRLENAIGGSFGMDQNHLLQSPELRALADSGQIDNPFEDPIGSILPAGQLAASPSMPPLHMEGPLIGVDQSLAVLDTIDFSDVGDMQNFEQSLDYSDMPFMNSMPGPFDEGLQTDATFLDFGSFNQNQFAIPSTMPTTTENCNIGSGGPGFPNNSTRLEGGSQAEAYQQISFGDAQPWMNHGQAGSTLQPRASLDDGSSSRAQRTQQKKPIMNALYDPIYEQMGLAIDPHIRLFLAKQARDKANKSSDKMMKKL